MTPASHTGITAMMPRRSKVGSFCGIIGTRICLGQNTLVSGLRHRLLRPFLMR